MNKYEQSLLEKNYHLKCLIDDDLKPYLSYSFLHKIKSVAESEFTLMLQKLFLILREYQGSNSFDDLYEQFLINQFGNLPIEILYNKDEINVNFKKFNRGLVSLLKTYNNLNYEFEFQISILREFANYDFKEFIVVYNELHTIYKQIYTDLVN